MDQSGSPAASVVLGLWATTGVMATSVHGVPSTDGKISHFVEDEKIARSGILATQIHSGGPLEVQFRNLRIKEIK